MSKHFAQITRDFSQIINMGALVVCGMKDGSNQEIAPPRTVTLERKAGQTLQFATKKARDAHVAAVNAEHPGAVVAL